MGNVIRLASGGAIQVRTGVLQGVGPEGPTGPVGPPGPDGGQGPQGEQGPAGQITQIQAAAIVSGTTTVTANTDILVAFGSVTHDDLAACTSSTVFTTIDAGDYLFTVWTGYGAAQANDLWVYSTTNAQIVVRNTSSGIYNHVSFTYRADANESFRVYTRSTSGGSVTAGAISITRTGSGPVGLTGPEGPQGIQGIQGIQGDDGPAGDANSGFTTYGDLLP